MSDTQYRILRNIDWERLNGQTVKVETSANWLAFELKDKSLVKFAQAKRPGHARKSPNGAGGERQDAEASGVLPVDAPAR